LARHSDEVPRTFPAIAGREDVMVVIKLEATEQEIA